MTTYAFQVELPVTDTLPRNRFENRFHLDHVGGITVDTDLEQMCSDIIGLYQTHLGNATHEVRCKAYDTDAVPNYPRANVVVNAGSAWTTSVPREICLCLSYCAHYSGNKNERGRMYLPIGLNASMSSYNVRPSQAQLDWALAWYTQSNSSFPDLGGVDWKFGVWSTTLKKFTQSTQAWVNDDWDVQRRRGLRESTRVTAQREG